VEKRSSNGLFVVISHNNTKLINNDAAYPKVIPACPVKDMVHPIWLENR